MTRVERVAEARRLRAEGLVVREIAVRMGVARSTAGAWLGDPDLSKQRARRASYSSRCVDCGRPTDGSGGFATRWVRCLACESERSHAERYWTPERVIEALRVWARELGRLPMSTEAHGRGCPVSCRIVQREFGSWSAGMSAAFGVRPKMGRRPKDSVAA